MKQTIRKYLPNLWAWIGSIPATRNNFFRRIAIDTVVILFVLWFIPMPLWGLLGLLLYALLPYACMYAQVRHVALMHAEQRRFFREWRAYNKSNSPLTMLEYIQLREKIIPRSRQFTIHRSIIAGGRRDSDIIIFCERVRRIYNWEDDKRTSRKHFADAASWRQYNGKYKKVSERHYDEAFRAAYILRETPS